MKIVRVGKRTWLSINDGFFSDSFLSSETWKSCMGTPALSQYERTSGSNPSRGPVFFIGQEVQYHPNTSAVRELGKTMHGSGVPFSIESHRSWDFEPLAPGSWSPLQPGPHSLHWEIGAARYRHPSSPPVRRRARPATSRALSTEDRCRWSCGFLDKGGRKPWIF